MTMRNALMLLAMLCAVVLLVAPHAVQVAEHVMICTRMTHGHIIPRRQPNGEVTDMYTNRLRYSNPCALGDTIGYVNQLAKRAIARVRGSYLDRELQLSPLPM